MTPDMSPVRHAPAGAPGASHHLHKGMPKISTIFQFDAFLVHALAFHLRQPPTPTAQTSDQHCAGAGFARSAAVGNSIGTGTPSGQAHREHGRGLAAVGQPTTATACSPRSPTTQNTHTARDRPHHGDTRHHHTCSACGRNPQHSTDSAYASSTVGAHGRGDPTGRQLCQTGLPQRLTPPRRRRHGDAEVFNWCRWPRFAGGD